MLAQVNFSVDWFPAVRFIIDPKFQPLVEIQGPWKKNAAADGREKDPRTLDKGLLDFSSEQFLESDVLLPSKRKRQRERKKKSS